MRQRDKQAPQSAEEAVRDIRRATGGTSRPRRKSASPRTSTTDGRKSFSKPARSGSPVTPHARRPPMKSRRSVPKPVSSRRRGRGHPRERLLKSMIADGEDIE